jgi:HK97 family phage prohead protease
MSETLTQATKNYIFNTGEVKALDDSSDQMLISGWASTGQEDLAGDIVLPNAFSKHWSFYETKGRYWLNHDPNFVLGRVRKSRLLKDGFYVDEAKLADTAFNKDYVWPLVKEGGLNEHSIQFMSIEPEMKGGILYHKEIKMIETSIVSVACNPGAIITGFKGLIPSEEYANATLEMLMQLDKEHKLKYPSEVRRSFYVSGFKNDQNTEEEMSTTETPAADLVDFKVISRTKTGYDPKGTVKADFKMPSPKAKSYEALADVLYLAKSRARNKHMYRVAVPTEKGWAYDWANIAISMGTILGAKGGSNYADGEKLAMLKEMFNIYAAIGKKLPTHEGEPLDNLSDDALSTLKFHEVAFVEGEDSILRLEIAKANVKALGDVMQHWRKDGGTPPAEFITYAKSVWPNFSAAFDIYPSDEESIAFFAGLMALYEAYLTAREARLGAYSYALTGVDTELKGKIELARLVQDMDIDAKYLEKKETAADEDDKTGEDESVVSKKSWLNDDEDDLESVFGNLGD